MRRVSCVVLILSLSVYVCVIKFYVNYLCVSQLCVSELCVSEVCVGELCVSELCIGTGVSCM